ncbi:MAG: metallophosphoesterase [Myxococcota bacterium]
MRRRLPLVILLLSLACGPGPVADDVLEPSADAAVLPDAGSSDAATPDDDAGFDAGRADGPDAGLDAPDAAQPEVDAGKPDAGLPDAGATRLRIAVLSDLNGSYGATTYESSVHQAVAALVTEVHPDVVLISGDMVAGQQAGLNYAAMWQGFHAAVTTPLTQAGIPVAPAPGNHDASAYAGYEAERDEYQRQWQPARRPAVQMVDGSHFPFRYSFAVRDTFFVALDATTVGALSSAQRTWVAQQLTAAASYRVRIVFGHVPIRPATVGRETQVLGDAALESLLVQHRALFVGGHHHGYFPGASSGLRHVVTPCLGSGPRALIGTSTTAPKGFVVIDVEDGRVSSLEARTGSSFRATIPRSSLPAELRFGPHLLVRDDLAGF